MKITKIFLRGAFAILLLLTIMSCDAEIEYKPSAEHIEIAKAEKQLTKNLEIYETVWDDILNKREIDKINETIFDTDITLITAPENIVGIQDFKDYYQNYLTGFSEVTFTLVNVFGQGDKIVKHWNFKGIHQGNFSEFQLRENKLILTE